MFIYSTSQPKTKSKSATQQKKQQIEIKNHIQYSRINEAELNSDLGQYLLKNLKLILLLPQGDILKEVHENIKNGLIPMFLPDVFDYKKITLNTFEGAQQFLVFIDSTGQFKPKNILPSKKIQKEVYSLQNNIIQTLNAIGDLGLQEHMEKYLITDPENQANFNLKFAHTYHKIPNLQDCLKQGLIQLRDGKIILDVSLLKYREVRKLLHHQNYMLSTAQNTNEFQRELKGRIQLSNLTENQQKIIKDGIESITYKYQLNLSSQINDSMALILIAICQQFDKCKSDWRTLFEGKNNGDDRPISNWPGPSVEPKIPKEIVPSTKSQNFEIPQPKLKTEEDKLEKDDNISTYDVTPLNGSMQNLPESQSILRPQPLPALKSKKQRPIIADKPKTNLGLMSVILYTTGTVMLLYIILKVEAQLLKQPQPSKRLKTRNIKFNRTEV